jgi:hypothetical protein
VLEFIDGDVHAVNRLFGFQRGICSELNHLTRDEGAPRLSYETKFQKHLRPRPPYRDS